MNAVPGVDIAAVLVLHAIGDYVIQSDWMANTKTKRSGLGWWAAVVHGATYTAPFLLLTTELWALALIGGTHVLIDHWRLARYLVWAKNWLAPVQFRRGKGTWEPRYVVESYNPAWKLCAATGMPRQREPWVAVWLMIIADNVVHVCINVAVLYWVATL